MSPAERATNQERGDGWLDAADGLEDRACGHQRNDHQLHTKLETTKAKSSPQQGEIYVAKTSPEQAKQTLPPHKLSNNSRNSER